MRTTRKTRNKLLAGLCLLAAAIAFSGCRTIGFYAQAAKGQYQLFANDKPIEKLLQDPKTPEPLKERFGLVQRLRKFAQEELELPVNGHYQKYADVRRPFVVWNVQAAPEFSLEPKTWWYPLVGSLQYRGYFSYSAATNYAGFLRRKGYDVSVGGVQAYSTLGWFKDPVLNTFIFEPDAELAETIFHELAHQRVFARGDTDFNEAFATTVGQEGARRWLRQIQDPTGVAEYEAHLKRNDQFVALVMRTRARLEALYGDERDEDGKLKATRNQIAISKEELRARKKQVYAELKKSSSDLRAKWSGPSEYDQWFDADINNADLNSVAAYFDLVPGFEHLLAIEGGNLGKFYQAAEALAKKPKNERHDRLRTLAKHPGQKTVTQSR